MGLWVEISNKMNLWSTTETNISEGTPFRLNTYMSRTRFEAIIFHFVIPIERMLNITMGSSTCVKWKSNGT